MKKYIVSFLAGAGLMFVVGATMDSSISEIAASVKRIAVAVEKLSGAPQR